MDPAIDDENDNIKVVIRIRPLSDREREAGFQIITQANSEFGVVRVLRPNGDEESKSFQFDTVFDIPTTQKDMFERVALPVVDNTLQGFNGTIMAYGQTGTGKTWTMEGNPDIPDQGGIIPNVFLHIFNVTSQVQNDTRYIIKVSFIEIYNEELRDLLSKSNSKKLIMKDHPNGGIYIEGREDYFVSSLSEMYKLLDTGKKNRATGATKMNEFSSRSHAIFTISIYKEQINSDGEKRMFTGKLHLVDLAGSERQCKSQNKGTRLKESIKINQSLTTLGLVISALAEGNMKHVRYRDSKLTRLLQDSLGGSAKTIMIATIGPADYNYKETICTLGYATRTKYVKNKIILNERVYESEHVKLLQDEVIDLRKKLALLTRTENNPAIVNLDDIEKMRFTTLENSIRTEQTKSKTGWRNCEMQKLELQRKKTDLEQFSICHETIQNTFGILQADLTYDSETDEFLENVRREKLLLQECQVRVDDRIQAELKLKNQISQRETELTLIEERYSTIKGPTERKYVSWITDDESEERMNVLMNLNPGIAVEMLKQNYQMLGESVDKYISRMEINNTSRREILTSNHDFGSSSLYTNGTVDGMPRDERYEESSNSRENITPHILRSQFNGDISNSHTHTPNIPSTYRVDSQFSSVIPPREEHSDHSSSSKESLELHLDLTDLCSPDDSDEDWDNEEARVRANSPAPDHPVKNLARQAATKNCDQIKEEWRDQNGCRVVRYRHRAMIKLESDEEDSGYNENSDGHSKGEHTPIQVATETEGNLLERTGSAHGYVTDNKSGNISQICYSKFMKGNKDDIINDTFWDTEVGDWKLDVIAEEDFGMHVQNVNTLLVN